MVATITRRNIGHTDSLVIVVEKDTVYACVATQIEVVLDVHDAMYIGWIKACQQRELLIIVTASYQ